MRALLVVSCLWPGLPRLWLRGDWLSLVAAVAFGAALNLVLVSNFVWPELLPTSLVIFGWLVVVAACCGGAVRSYRQLPAWRGAETLDDRGLFIDAQGEYLQGHWYEAERLLQQLIGRSPRDVDALLMLATLCRHTNRRDEAQERLRNLERLEGADRWRWEIARERDLLQREPDAEMPAERRVPRQKA